MKNYEENMEQFKVLYKRKSDWVERVKGLKFSLDSLQCDKYCYFFDKSAHKCDFCQSRSKMSWILKQYIDQMIYCTGTVFREFVQMEPRPSFCGLVQNFDDVIYCMELIEFDMAQDAESYKDGELSWMYHLTKLFLYDLRNYHTTAADQIETLSL